MKLASVLSYHFDNDVRLRGASYYRLGAVRVKRGNAMAVAAGVRGSRVYDVEIAWDGRRLLGPIHSICSTPPSPPATPD